MGNFLIYYTINILSTQPVKMLFTNHKKNIFIPVVWNLFRH